MQREQLRHGQEHRRQAYVQDMILLMADQSKGAASSSSL
jgi:hypothetical protein